LVSDAIDDKTNYALSAGYTWNSLYLGAAYVHSDLSGVKAGNYSGDVTLDGYDLVASYGIDAWTLYTGYAYQEADGDHNFKNVDTADAFKLGAQYSFTSNFKNALGFSFLYHFAVFSGSAFIRLDFDDAGFELAWHAF